MSLMQLFEDLFRLHKKELLVFASERAADVAEDLVQESFLRLIQHPEPQTIKNPRAYLYKITANSVIDHHRKNAVREKYAVYEVDYDSLPSSYPDLEETIHHQMLLERCLIALDTLPEIQRTIFFLHGFDDLSYPEIAKMLRISRATAERHFTIALEHCFLVALQNKKQQ